MKRFFGIILLTLFLFIPNVKADIKSESIEEALKNEGIEQLFTKYVEKEKEETLYLFRTKGEDLSNQFLSYLNRIYEDYGDFFNIKIYEVSGNADNKELMEKAIEHLKIETDTTPIAILDTAYITTYNENVDDSLKQTIMYIHNTDKDKRVDKLKEVMVRAYRNDDLILGVFFLIVIVFIIFMFYAYFKGKKDNIK